MKKVFTTFKRVFHKLISFISFALNHKRVDLDKKRENGKDYNNQSNEINICIIVNEESQESED